MVTTLPKDVFLAVKLKSCDNDLSKVKSCKIDRIFIADEFTEQPKVINGASIYSFSIWRCGIHTDASTNSLFRCFGVEVIFELN